jgi:hypothetical protein
MERALSVSKAMLRTSMQSKRMTVMTKETKRPFL